MAKQIIKLLCYISRDIDQNPRIREKLQVVFLEDYNVSLAETLIPSAEISEQISLAGKEASGTGCMKLMINGALTLGTMDGANIEMLAAAGEDNMFIFGLNREEVDALWLSGYNSALYYACNDKLKRIVDYLNVGFAGQSFSDIAAYLLSGHGIADPYLCLADFESYRKTHADMIEAYQDKNRWNRMSLCNIAAAGYFAADRSIRDYANNIWNLRTLPKDAERK
jgi:starch phosphorylase